MLERDAEGHPTRARTKLRVEHGPLKHDFDLVMSVNVDPVGMVKLSRIPHEPDDPERFDVTWRMDGGNPSTRVRLDLAANLSVPRFLPLGGVGDSLAQGLVSAATRALALPDRAVAGLQVERLGEQLVGAPARLVVVGDRHHDHLLGAVLGGHRLDLGPHFGRRADDRPPAGPTPVQRLALAVRGIRRPSRAAAPGSARRGEAG